MVRFIMLQELGATADEIKFTFQYGQIYYGKTSKDFQAIFGNLHSNMVRFIISQVILERKKKAKFTFQYGQIYYISYEL